MFSNVRKAGTGEPGEVRQIPENGQIGKTDFERGYWGSVLLNWLYLEGKEWDSQIHILNKTMDLSTGQNTSDPNCAPASVSGHCLSLDRRPPFAMPLLPDL